jgi:hypothetical protein
MVSIEAVLWACLIIIAVYLSGYITGRLHANAKHRLEESKTPPEICQCNHGVAFHDQHGCHAIKVVTEKVVLGTVTKSNTYEGKVTKPVTENKVVDRYECPCLAYVGPGSEYHVDLRLAALDRVRLEGRTPSDD